MKLKQRIAKWLLPKLINSVEVNDVIHYDRNGIYLGGRKMDKDELRILREEIKFFEKARIWSIITNTLAFKAIERIGEKSTSFDDVWSGKMMLLNIEIQKEILTVLRNYKFPETIKPIANGKVEE